MLSSPDIFRNSQHVWYRAYLLLAFGWILACGSCLAVEIAAAKVDLRAGLPHLAARLHASQPVTVAFLGGSITEQGWYVRATMAWFAKTWPQVQFTTVNAGVAGMASTYGVYRVEKTVLVANPDLVVVEFAVNDGDNPTQAGVTRAAMEGIVRQVRQAKPECDLLFVYNARATAIPTYQAGGVPPGAAAHEQVAAHYGIPGVFLVAEAAQRISAGTLRWSADAGKPDAEKLIEESRRRSAAGEEPDQKEAKAKDQQPVFTVDGVHPNALGGELSAAAIATVIQRCVALPAHASAKPLPPPLETGSQARARLVAMTEGTGWTRIDLAADAELKRYRRASIDLWAGVSAAKATLRFTGTRVSLQVLGGAGCGAMSVVIDGGAARRIAFEDRYTVTTKRLGIIDLPLAEQLPEGPHVVELTMLEPGRIAYFRILGEAQGPGQP